MQYAQRDEIADYADYNFNVQVSPKARDSPAALAKIMD
jgi:hypothetical protein